MHVQHDDVDKIMENYEWEDIIISVSPSYWADILGQFKAFIDRCTPWCNTHEPHAALSAGKKGYVVALRTGTSMRECQRIFMPAEPHSF
ncbi:MAG: flavodoxin family protein [Ruminococcus sp.]|nr:flavodoxin family protein [Ruminococcus sp.]